MGELQTILLFILGLVFVIKGAVFLVDGSASIAKRLSIPEIVIGLTIVSFGTSAPELIVNIFSSIGNKNEIVLGNVIGSNIFNILLILGVAGIIYPLEVQKNTVWKEIPFSLLGVPILLLLVNDKILFNNPSNVLSLFDGIVLLLLFFGFFIYIFIISKIKVEDEIETKNYSLSRAIIFIIVGFVGLFIGGKLVVDNAVIIAQKLGISEKLIALTIISAGTSLPELATSAVAAYRKKCDIAVGNIVGSNIFNIFFILGISAIIKPVGYNISFNIDLLVLLFASFLLFLTMFTGKKQKLDRWEAILFLFFYVGYLIFLIYRM